MKTLTVKILFNLASWLYNYGIVAPQILESNSVIILPPDCSELDINYYVEKQKEIKNHTNKIMKESVSRL